MPQVSSAACAVCAYSNTQTQNDPLGRESCVIHVISVFSMKFLKSLNVDKHS